MSGRFRFLVFFAGAVIAAAALAACSPVVDTRGNAPDPEKLAEIKPGVHTREQVARLLGSPSAVATFGNDTWYYVNKQTETLAFFRPKVRERQIIAIHFDESGVVQEVRRYNNESGREITPVARTTPAPGEELGLFEQLFGNLGRGAAY